MGSEWTSTRNIHHADNSLTCLSLYHPTIHLLTSNSTKLPHFLISDLPKHIRSQPGALDHLCLGLIQYAAKLLPQHELKRSLAECETPFSLIHLQQSYNLRRQNLRLFKCHETSFYLLPPWGLATNTAIFELPGGKTCKECLNNYIMMTIRRQKNKGKSIWLMDFFINKGQMETNASNKHLSSSPSPHMDPDEQFSTKPTLCTWVITRPQPVWSPKSFLCT